MSSDEIPILSEDGLQEFRVIRDWHSQSTTDSDQIIPRRNWKVKIESI